MRRRAAKRPGSCCASRPVVAQRGSTLTLKLMRKLVSVLTLFLFHAQVLADVWGTFELRTMDGRRLSFSFVNSEHVSETKERESYRVIDSVEIEFENGNSQKAMKNERCTFEDFRPYRSESKWIVKLACPLGAPSPLGGTTYIGAHVKEGRFELTCVKGCPPSPFQNLRYIKDHGE